MRLQLPGLNLFFSKPLQKVARIEQHFLINLPCKSEKFDYIKVVSLSGGSGDWATPEG